MTPTRPYLIRALHEWILDNGLTPHLLVAVGDDRVKVPMQFVKDGSIVLNLSPTAVRDLNLGNDFISFSARFGGVAHSVMFPVSAARMIFARENGRGMALPEETEADEEPSSAEVAPPPPDDEPPPPRGGHLRRVK